MKLIRVGEIVLDEGLFLDSEFDSDAISATALRTIEGGEVVFARQNKARELYFSANGVAWNSKASLNALIALANNADESVIVLEFDTGEVISARFDYANQPVVSGEPLFVGSDLFYLTLKFKEN